MPIIKRTTGAKDALLDPRHDVWEGAEATLLALQPTPVALQPSEYVQSTVQQEEVGAVKGLEVRALYDDLTLYFRLNWEDPRADEDTSDPSAFADGAAIMFPFGADAPLITMGSPAQPVNQWHWRADVAAPFNVTTAGLGTTYRTPASSLEAQGVWQAGRWFVVLARPLQTDDPDNQVPFQRGSTIKAAFCIWEGAARERAGLKAYSPQWTEFSLEE